MSFQYYPILLCKAPKQKIATNPIEESALTGAGYAVCPTTNTLPPIPGSGSYTITNDINLPLNGSSVALSHAPQGDLVNGIVWVNHTVDGELVTTELTGYSISGSTVTITDSAMPTTGIIGVSVSYLSAS